jgi:nitrogen regulatory protein PII
MQPLTFITDETHNRRYVQIDLAEMANIDDEQLEDIMDVIVAEARKGDEKIWLEDLESQLKAEGRL